MASAAAWSRVATNPHPHRRGRSNSAFLPTARQQGHVCDGLSLQVFRIASLHPASSALLASMFSNELGVAPGMARLSPAFALTFLQAFGHVCQIQIAERW